MRLRAWFRPIALSLLFCALGGMSNAAMDKASFHYDRSVFSTLGDDGYFNPALSWKNKWQRDEKGEVIAGKERFPGASTVFVNLTDFWHLAKTGMLAAVMLAVVCYRRRASLTVHIVDFALLYIAFTGTFSLFFDGLFVR